MHALNVVMMNRKRRCMLQTTFFCVKHVSSQRCGGRYECSIMRLFDLNKKSSFSRKIRQYLTANAYCFVEKFGKKQFLVACGGYLR